MRVVDRALSVILFSWLCASFKQGSGALPDSEKTLVPSALTSLSKSSRDTHRRESDVGEELSRIDSSRSPLDEEDSPRDFGAVDPSPPLLTSEL